MIFILKLPAFAQAWRKEVFSKLPSPLTQIVINKTTKEDVEKLIGKGALEEGNSVYWEYEGFKYSLQIKFKNKIVESLHYTFTKEKPPLSLIQKYIDKKKLKPFPENAKSSSKYFKDEHPAGAVVFDPINKNIYSVEFK